jgi:hypothetical protein
MRQWKQQADVAIDTKVCDCCTTSIATTPEGPIVAFRNRTDTEVRDIHISRFVAGKWTEGTVVHNDGWTIHACPVNGPAVSAHGRDVAVAWFTVKGDEGHAFVAFSADAGRTFGQPIRLDDATSLGCRGRRDARRWERGRDVAGVCGQSWSVPGTAGRA